MVILILETFFWGGHHFMPGIGRNQAEQRRVANEAFNLLEDGDADLKQKNCDLLSFDENWTKNHADLIDLMGSNGI